MTNINSLPFEVIDYIVNCDCLSYVDICRLSCVSKMFNCITKNNKLWKKKYAEMWPNIATLLGVDTDWHRQFSFRIKINKLIWEKLPQLSDEYFLYENISNEAFLYFKDISRFHPKGYNIVVDELENIIHRTDSNLYLTEKYYACKALRYMRHSQLTVKWKNYLYLEPDEMSFIEGASLISQWCQPTVLNCSSEVSTDIEDIVKMTFEKVKQLFPQHPVLKQGILKKDRILSSLWSSHHCKNIIYCINAVLFQDLKFKGRPVDSQSPNIAFIDHMLKTKAGMHIPLGIIYSAVAAKLGVCCEPINIPVLFLLKWQENLESNERESFMYIDVIENGALKTFSDVVETISGAELLLSSSLKRTSPVDVFVRWAWYLVEFERQRNGLGEDSLGLLSALELLCLLSPEDVDHKMLLARLFMHLKINTNEAISLLQDIAAVASPLMNDFMYQSTLRTLEAQRIPVRLALPKFKVRSDSDDVKFAVGMVMRHKKYNYRCVIYAWDYLCSASSDWIKRMGVDNLKSKAQQPFYYVLVPDSTDRYAAQENLVIDHENKPIDHIRIGKYFESFHGAYYRPNEQLLSEYPGDIDAREKALNPKNVNCEVCDF